MKVTHQDIDDSEDQQRKAMVRDGYCEAAYVDV